MDQVTRLSERAINAGGGEKPGRVQAGDHDGLDRPWHRKILVVDDDADISGSIRFLLRLSGAWVESSLDGVKAVEMAKTFRPDVVILDIGMPGQDGYDTCRSMRRLRGGRTLAIIAITGRGGVQDKQQCRDAGFDYHLIKPVEIELLQSVVAEAMTFEGVGIR
jgi:CheY-like chemotaxis protein